MGRYVYHCALRWSDLDAFGHVNNARFLTLYEEARVALLFTDARRHGVTSIEEGVVIARQEIDYLRPIGYRAGPATPERVSPQVRIEMWIDDLRSSRVVIAYELFDRDELASRAVTVCVPFDLATGRPRRLTDAERAYLEPWQQADDV